VFDLLSHTSYTLPYEHTSPIRRVVVSPDSRFLLSVDEVRRRIGLPSIPPRTVSDRPRASCMIASRAKIPPRLP
jgi:hypothetical protein